MTERRNGRTMNCALKGLHRCNWVIFDEIHCVRDKKRGVVWDETIILLLNTICYISLSAPIPNSMQFAEWAYKWHQQPCHVAYADFRLTPLQHALFLAGGEGLSLIVNKKGELREDSCMRVWIEQPQKTSRCAVRK